MDSSLETRVKESSTKQVAQNKYHFPQDTFRKFACDSEKEIEHNKYIWMLQDDNRFDV